MEKASKEDIDNIGLKKQDTSDRTKWRDGAYELRSPLLTKKIGFKIVDLSPLRNNSRLGSKL